MTRSNELLKTAVARRLKGTNADMLLFVALGILSVTSGVGLFVILWLEFRTDETELISQLAGASTTLVTAGLGGAFLNKVISLRQAKREGQEWISLYEDALGPPPDHMVPEIQEKILSWLGG